MIYEAPHVFGQRHHLVGIYSPPQTTVTTAAQTGVVMLTPGMLHHVGPFGLHVALARELAEEGLASFRFCLSGIGESLAVGGAEESTRRAVNETRQAMDYLHAMYGLKRFMLFGLCSGADDAVNVALEDERVCGLALMDGCGYRTAGYYWRKFGLGLPALLRRRWARLWMPRGEEHRRSGQANAQTLLGGEDAREFPDRANAEQQFKQLADRGVELFFFYTGGVRDYFNHRSQFEAMFPRLRGNTRVKSSFVEHLDHVTRLKEDRQLVIGQIKHWMCSVC